MKKTILSLALLAGAAGAANAQTGAKLGISGGANLANFTGTDSKNFGYKFGFSVGVVANFGVSDMFSVQPEVLYSEKGFNTSDVKFSNTATGAQTQATVKQTLKYLDIPILLKINTGDAGKGLFFELGPQLSLLAGSHTFSDDASLANAPYAYFNSDANSPVAVRLGKGKNGLNNAVIGYVGGIGYQLTSGLGFGLRYTGDVSQVYKDNNSPLAPNVHNGVFQFNVHYMFGGKG